MKFVLALFFSFSVFADDGLVVPEVLDGAEIINKVGEKIPLDIALTDHNGDAHVFGDYLKSTRPVILTIGYWGCPMLCTLVLNGLVNGLKDMGLHVGQDFNLVSVSINPQDTPELATAKRANYLQSLRAVGALPPLVSGQAETNVWSFNVGSETEVKRLADAVGFGYKYHARSEQYAHGAGIFVVSPDGKLSRTLWGIEYKSRDLKLAIVEAAQGKVGSVVDRILLSCFHYDPDSRKYGVFIMGTMRLGGAITLLGLGSVLAFFWLGERKRRWKI